MASADELSLPPLTHLQLLSWAQMIISKSSRGRVTGLALYTALVLSSPLPFTQSLIYRYLGFCTGD
jgi:hypothetical protein